MPGEVEYKTFGIYPVIGTQTGATGSWTGIIDVPQLYDGLTIAYYLPYAGDGNASLNLTLSDGSTTGAINCYYTGTSRLTTHYAAGSTILLTYWSAGSISVAGTATTDNRWTRADYNTNTNTLLRTYSSATNIDVPLIGQSSANSTTAAWTTYTGTYKDWYGAIPNDDTKRAKINLSTGAMTVPGGITANLTGIATKATQDGNGNNIASTYQTKHKTATITIAVSNWSNNACTKTVSGVTASNTIVVSADPASQDTYNNASIKATSQGANSVTFQCSSTPSASVTVNILIFNI